MTKSFCSVEGEWNGVMLMQNTQQEKYSFYRYQKLPIMKKVRKLEDQTESTESHCLWKGVTFNLKIRDIDVAAEARYRLEERQTKFKKEGQGNSMGDKVVS